MEELNYKLLTDDPSIIAQIISKLTQNIQGKFEISETDNLELTFLRNKCINLEPKISEVAASGILLLTARNILQLQLVLADCLTLIPNTKISSGLVKLIGNLLYLDLTRKVGSEALVTTGNEYNVFTPQHPFITLLKEDPDCLSYIYKEIKSKDASFNWHHLHYPFYQYVVCNPTTKKLNIFKVKLWKYIIETNCGNEITPNLISWMQIDSAHGIELTSEFINELSTCYLQDLVRINLEMLLMIQISVLHQLLLCNINPSDTIDSIKSLVFRKFTISSNPILLILSKSILIASSVYILEVLKICRLFVYHENADPIILQAVKSSVLQWIGNPSELASNAVKVANDIYFYIENRKSREIVEDGFLIFFNKYEKLIRINKEVFIASEMYLLCKSWREDKSKILNFLSELEDSSEYFIENVINVISALFVGDSMSEQVTLKAFQILTNHSTKFRKMSSHMLMLILYKLSNATHPELHFHLLKCLPKMAAAKENYQKVLTTLIVLFNGSNALKTTGMLLMYDLWTITDKKCYPHLEKMLTAQLEDSFVDRWEYASVKANIIKQLCVKNSALYGKDMVAHISKILNENSEADGTLASILALEAIVTLCKEGIIDINTTWTTLSPKFLKETRSFILKSFCGLISEIPKISHSDQYPDLKKIDELKKDVVSRLWEYVLKNDDRIVKKAALTALSSYDLESICTSFPKEWLDEETLENQKGAQLQIKLIPGKCWVNFLQNHSSLDLAGDFLIKMISQEVDNYLKCVYNVSRNKEPINFCYLPSHSFVRGIGEYVISQPKVMRCLHKPVYLECLRIFSQEYGKPLPPYNWSILQELVHYPEAKEYCIKIASHQVILSGTARRFMENYISALTDNYSNEEDVITIYKNMKYLANSIQPAILKPYFQKTLRHAVTLYTRDNYKTFLLIILDNVQHMLLNTTIQDTNKKSITEVITDIFETTDTSDEIFDVLLQSIVKFPINYLTRLTTIPPAAEMNPKTCERAVCIRCALALQTSKSPLDWLNDIIDVGSVIPIVGTFTNSFEKVLKKQKNKMECASWIMGIMGRIEAAVGDNCNSGTLLHLMDVLIVAIVVFSGFHIFINAEYNKIQEYIKLFPQATMNLLEINEWSACTAQALQCFYHLNSKSLPLLPVNYRNMCGKTVQALRHDDEFKKNMKWMKFINAKIDI